MKLRLTQPGYETLTGRLGAVTFTNGVSDDELSAEMAAGVAGIVRCEEIVNTVDVGALDETDPTVVRDDVGDIDQSTEPAPLDPVLVDVEVQTDQ